MISDKDKVVTVLRESEKPLKAKAIAYQIFKRFKGYRLSRYRVRDVLWHEIKENIYYDRDNYTYQLKNEKDLFSGIIDDETTINNQAQNKISLYRFLKDQEELTFSPLLYSFYYNLPEKENIRLNPESIVKEVNEGKILPSRFRETFEVVCKNTSDEIENQQDWEIIYLVLRKSYLSKEKLRISDQIIRLREQLSNPFHYALILCDLGAEQEVIRFKDERFQRIFDECARDNIITGTEERYLYEKARELKVDKTLVEKAVEASDMKAYHSFKLLVDEICEDGVITDSEKQYIEEKSRQYNVSKGQLNRMISSSLKKVKLINQFKFNTHFIDYIISIFLFRSFDCGEGNLYPFTIMEKEVMFLDAINVEVNSTINDIVEAIYSDYGLNIDFQTISDILEYLELPIIDPRISFSDNKISDYNFGNLLEQDTIIKLDGYNYEIKWIDIKNKPLFTVDYINSTYLITLNAASWVFDFKNESEKRIVEKVILSLFSTKNEFNSKVIDSFFEKLKGKVEHLKYEYSN